ncbi:MAG TPA: sodium:proton exchanger, partial [Mycobacteriales bacterium]|nr:sodium:proton exchanger [Mycobacteriales bacterium]
MSSVLVFIAGAALLVFSAEKLIDHLVGVASGLHVSLFLLAVIFTGIEFDDVFLGVALNIEDLGQVALGLVLGTAISMSGIVLALAAILTPTRIDVPRDYVVIFAAAPLVLIVFTLTAPLTAIDGAVLLGLFVLFIGYVTVRESGRTTPVFRDAELYQAHATVGGSGRDRPVPDDRPVRAGTVGPADLGQPPGGASGQHPPATPAPTRTPGRSARSAWARLGLAVLALAGLVLGAAVTGVGTDGILRTYRLQGTVFGATIATVVLTLEDLFLTVEPTRRGAPEIGVGNVIGSVVFGVTGKLGVIVLAGSLVV